MSTPIPSKGNGQARAQEATRRLQAYIDAHHPNLPLRGGELNRTAICKAIGVGRSTANQNPQFKAILDSYTKQHLSTQPSLGSSSAHPSHRDKNNTTSTNSKSAKDMVPLKDLRASEKRANKLEQRLIEALARNAELQDRLRTIEAREEYLIATGRAWTPRD